MQLSKLIACLLLHAAAFAVVIEVYSLPDCRGAVRRVNIWSYTCMTHTRYFQSFKPVKLGPEGYKIAFFDENACVIWARKARFWQGGRDANFKLGKCTNLDFYAQAVNSRGTLGNM